MARGSTIALEAILRRKVNDFVACRAAYREALRSALNDITARGQTTFLFGGTLRDMMVFGLRRLPRDLDIVVASMTPALRELLAESTKKRTRFGGFQLELRGWEFDLWALEDTWAFRNGLVSAKTFRDLPRTTFLDVQAIVAELAPRPGKPRRIYSHGFFEAVRSKTVDINFEENPFPLQCVMSGLMTARRLGFAIGARLARYVLAQLDHIELEEIVDQQTKHYGKTLYGCEVLHSWVEAIREQQRQSNRMPVRLPIPEPKQSRLPLTKGMDRA